MKQTITIPDFFQVKHYKKLNSMSSLDEMEQMISVVSALTETSIEDIMKWELSSVIDVYNALQNIFKNINPEFYPVVEWNGQLWGFANMSKMKLGEYIDMDSLAKDTEKNINQILSLLYRPITKNDIPSATFIVKSTLKSMKYDVENVFDYYEIEPYDSKIRKQRADSFNEFPVEIALGALGFFLDINTVLLSDFQQYSHKIPHQMILEEMSKMSKVKRRLLSTMAGYLHLKTWLKHPSYKLQEINQS